LTIRYGSDSHAKLQFAHTLNGLGLALDRIQPDG
jgi:seryl-tRNA synthetase